MLERLACSDSLVAKVRTEHRDRFTWTDPGQIQTDTGCYGNLTHHPRSGNVRELDEIYASGTVFYPVLAAGGR
jgi:hypothetical protein